MTELAARLRAFVGREHAPAFEAPDPVNEAMIRHWTLAVGDRNPVYTDAAAAARAGFDGIVAPPAMLQAWTMRPPDVGSLPAPPASGAENVLRVLDEAGYTSVVATNCEQEYVRYLRPGDRLTERTLVESVSEEKTTALGTGFFVTLRYTWTDQDGAPVGSQLFRVLKFKPPERRPAPQGPTAPGPQRRPEPLVDADNAFFWEGAGQGRLLIQRCAECGTLRHPPRPMCGVCRSVRWDTVESAGRGEVFSWIVPRHPKLPVFGDEYVVVLVALDEGVRIVSNLVGVDPADVRIGMRVEVVFDAPGGGRTLPLFGPAGGG